MKKLFLAMALAIVTGTVVSAQGNSKENTIVVPAVQTDKDGGYDGSSATNCGIKFNTRLSGVTKVRASTAIRWQVRRVWTRTPIRWKR